MTDPAIHVSDRALLRYLERGFDLDIETLRRHVAGHCMTGARLGAVAVRIERVKFVLANHEAGTTVVTVLKPGWPAKDPRSLGE